MFLKITQGVFDYPALVNKTAQDLINKLLRLNPDQRLGAKGVHEIKQHSWFHAISWDNVKVKKVGAPWRPELTSEYDYSHFEKYPDSGTPVQEPEMDE